MKSTLSSFEKLLRKKQKKKSVSARKNKSPVQLKFKYHSILALKTGNSFEGD